MEVKVFPLTDDGVELLVLVSDVKLADVLHTNRILEVVPPLALT
jgi:hypothetical protein